MFRNNDIQFQDVAARVTEDDECYRGNLGQYPDLVFQARRSDFMKTDFTERLQYFEQYINPHAAMRKMIENILLQGKVNVIFLSKHTQGSWCKNERIIYLSSDELDLTRSLSGLIFELANANNPALNAFDFNSVDDSLLCASLIGCYEFQSCISTYNIIKEGVNCYDWPSILLSRYKDEPAEYSAEKDKKPSVCYKGHSHHSLNAMHHNNARFYTAIRKFNTMIARGNEFDADILEKVSDEIYERELLKIKIERDAETSFPKAVVERLKESGGSYNSMIKYKKQIIEAETRYQSAKKVSKENRFARRKQFCNQSTSPRSSGCRII